MRSGQNPTAERKSAPSNARRDDDYSVTMLPRHLEAIMDALKFSHKLLSGDLEASLGKAAMDAWRNLPDEASGCYPARRGEESAVRDAAIETCREIMALLWPGGAAATDFADSRFGATAKRLVPDAARDTQRRFSVSISERDLHLIWRAVELELRTRIGHLSVLEDRLLDECTIVGVGSREWCDLRDRLDSAFARLKPVAWQIQPSANYSLWFCDRTKFLYDIYQVIQRERGSWRYSQVIPAFVDVQPMEITRLH